MGFKERKSLFYFFLCSSLIEISSGVRGWLACLFPPFDSFSLALWDKQTALHYEREGEREFILPLTSDQMFELGQFLRKKSTITTRDCYHRRLSVDPWFMSFHLISPPPPSHLLFCFLQMFSLQPTK